MHNSESKNPLTARVTSEHRGAYTVKIADREYLAKVTGKRIFQASSREDYPAVGDWVSVTLSDENQAVINDILPRQTIIKRKRGHESQVIAANIDVAFIMESVDRDYNLNRFERYFALVKNGGITPAIILNKIDLLSPEELKEKTAEISNRFPTTRLFPTSLKDDDSLDNLKKYITKDKTYCFLGSSGVGKSSLVNKLLGKDLIKTKDVSARSDRGKHTTTNRQMYFLPNGGIIIDNPGMREVALADTSERVTNFFDDISDLAQGCQYADCSHLHEPGCAVLAAVKSGKLDQEKYSNYLNLKKEAEHYEMSELEKRENDRQFGKMIKRFKKESKNFEG